MKVLVSVALLATLLAEVPDAIGPIARKSNSEASSQRGREAFAEGRYEDAVREFVVAEEIKPGPESSFNLGTSRIAAGDVAGGLQALSTALQDDALATDVRYNAGWAALEVKDYNNAIQAFEQVLRERPGDGNAKRNLEIALRKRQEQQQQQQEQQQQQPGDQPNAEQPPRQPEENEQDGDQPPPQADQPREGASDIDSILRSVEQQEKEELDRMRRSRRGRKVDW